MYIKENYVELKVEEKEENWNKDKNWKDESGNWR